MAVSESDIRITTHISRPIVRILEKIDRVITALYCTLPTDCLPTFTAMTFVGTMVRTFVSRICTKPVINLLAPHLEIWMKILFVIFKLICLILVVGHHLKKCEGL